LKHAVDFQLKLLNSLPINYDEANMLTIDSDNDKDNKVLPTSTMVQIYQEKKGYKVCYLEKGHGSVRVCKFKDIPSVDAILSMVDFEPEESVVVKGDTPISTIKFNKKVPKAFDFESVYHIVPWSDPTND